MASSDEKIRALIGAGIPSEKVAAVTEKAQLLCEEFTSLGISKMEDKLNVILILFDIKQKKHGVAPLPDKLKSFTTISELSILSQPKKKSEQALQDWESTKFQNNELRMDFKDTASKLDESLSQEVTRMMGDKELRFQLLDVLVVSYDCFNGVYGALWENVEMTDGKGIQRYKDMQKDFKDSIHKSGAAGHTPQQNSEDLIDLYLSYALTVETFDRKMKGVASKTGAKWKLAPAKKAFRILEKKNLRPGARGVILVCDAGRGMFEAETMNDVCKVRVAVLELSATDPSVWIVRIKERYIDASSGGWRDDLINFKIMHENGGFHVFEAQISQGKMLTARQSLDGHLVFNKCRNATELLTACFGDFAPLLALAVGKAGDKMVAWAKANRWFLEDDISNWGGVRSNVDGKINGFDLVGMTMGVADKFLEACVQHCAPLVKYLAIDFSGEQGIDFSGEQGTWGIASSIKPLGKNLIELRLGGCKGIEGHIEELFGEASQLEVIDLRNTGVSGKLQVFEHTPNLKELNLQNCRVIGDISVFENTPALQECSLEKTEVTGDVAVFGFCPNITTVHLGTFSSFSRKANISGNIEVFQATPNMANLDLTECRNIEGNVSVFENTPLLEKLSLERCYKITGDVSVFRFCPNITYVNVVCTKVFGGMTQGVFDVLCGVAELYMLGTPLEFAEFVIGKYKESGGKLTEITNVSERTPGSIDVLEFVGADLQVVELCGCPLIKGDVSVFETTPALTACSLGETEVTGDISVFRFCPNITDVNVRCTKVFGDVSVFEQNPELVTLNLGRCLKITGTLTGSIIRMICDIRANGGTADLRDCGKFTLADDLSSITDMTHIDLSDIKSLEGDIGVIDFKNNPQLVTLDLLRCGGVTGDISFFEFCPNVTDVILGGTKVTGDISVFRFCPNITDVSLYNTQVSGDVIVFKNTPALKELNLYRTQVTGDICGFENALALEKLNLRKTKVIGDISAFEKHQSLQELYLSNCRGIIGDQAAITEQLPNCNINF